MVMCQKIRHDVLNSENDQQKLRNWTISFIFSQRNKWQPIIKPESTKNQQNYWSVFSLDLKLLIGLIGIDQLLK